MTFISLSSSLRTPTRLVLWAVMLGQFAGLRVVHAQEPDVPVRRVAIPGTEVSFGLARVPAGTFVMGSPESEIDRNDDEGPPWKVSVPAFWIGTHEVTWAEYHCFMRLCRIFEKFEDRGIRSVVGVDASEIVTAPSKLYDSSFTYGTGDDPQQPAVSMSQFAAKQYTKWLSLLTGEFFRLPSEAEWEYACRAGSTKAFAFGDSDEQLTEFACFTDNSDDATEVVGSKRPNAWGLYDMHGNVSEWVLDAYHEHYEVNDGGTNESPGLGSEAVSAVKLIRWPTKTYPRVLRGGSWDSDAEDCRSSARQASNDDELRSYDPNVPKSPWWFASDEGQTIGFRLVCPVDPPPRAEREKYWAADTDEIRRAVKRRIDEEGRGKRGWVDPALPDAIEALN